MVKHNLLIMIGNILFFIIVTVLKSANTNMRDVVSDINIIRIMLTCPDHFHNYPEIEHFNLPCLLPKQLRTLCKDSKQIIAYQPYSYKYQCNNLLPPALLPYSNTLKSLAESLGAFNIGTRLDFNVVGSTSIKTTTTTTAAAATKTTTTTKTSISSSST